MFYFTFVVLSSPKRRLGSIELTSNEMASLVILVLGDSLEKYCTGLCDDLKYQEAEAFVLRKITTLLSPWCKPQTGMGLL